MHNFAFLGSHVLDAACSKGSVEGWASSHVVHDYAYQDDGAPLPTCCTRGCGPRTETLCSDQGVFEVQNRIAAVADKDLN